MPSNPPHLRILTSSKPHEFFNSLENRDLTPGSEAAQLSATLFSQKDPGLCLQVGRGTLYGCGGGRHGPLGTAGGSSGIPPTQIRPSLRTRCWPRSLAAQLEDSSHLSCPVPGFPPNPTSPHSWAWCPSLADCSVLPRLDVQFGGHRARPFPEASGDGILGREMT